MAHLSWYLSIRGERWRFRLTQPHELEEGEPEYDTEGDCDFARKRIRVSLDLSPKRFTYVVIHEVLHACFPDHDEQAIIEAGHAVNNALWKLEWIWKPAWRTSSGTENRSQYRS